MTWTGWGYPWHLSIGTDCRGFGDARNCAAQSARVHHLREQQVMVLSTVCLARLVSGFSQHRFFKRFGAPSTGWNPVEKSHFSAERLACSAARGVLLWRSWPFRFKGCERNVAWNGSLGAVFQRAMINWLLLPAEAFRPSKGGWDRGCARNAVTRCRIWLILLMLVVAVADPFVAIKGNRQRF